MTFGTHLVYCHGCVNSVSSTHLLLVSVSGNSPIDLGVKLNRHLHLM